MEQSKKSKIYNLAKILNGEGISILSIDDEYFATEDFMPADRNVSFHKVKGKHITNIIEESFNFGLQGQQLVSVIQKIEALPVRELQYHGDVSWKWMIR